MAAAGFFDFPTGLLTGLLTDLTGLAGACSSLDSSSEEQWRSYTRANQGLSPGNSHIQPM